MIALRGLLQRHGRRALGLAVLGLVCIAIVWAHAGGEGHMAGDEMGKAISACLAVVQGGLGVLLAGLTLAALRRRLRPVRSLAVTVRGPVAYARLRHQTPIRPRAGPALFQVFRS